MHCAGFTGLATLSLLLGAASGAVAADHVDFANIAKSRYVHCAFYKAYETDPATGDPIMVEGKADSLVHFQNVDAERATAKAIYTRMSGSHEVRVIKTEKALHFIENIAGMYIMTTVHSCLEYDAKRGACVMYGAVKARLLDSAVL
ncbi:MAG: hypothetical protein JWN94_1612, partial [Betaproteobacteria bacterium]|nr:hypothetical protein [Betaproteobacteria bacterium]